MNLDHESRVAVLMPAYNVGPLIGRAIESVLNQTHDKLELLIIDDGSKDDTYAVATSYMQRDPRVRVVTQDNAGISPTMNRGLTMVEGDWVFLMHGDDLMMPNRIERQVAFLMANPDVAVASSLVLYINDRDQIVGRSRCPFTSRTAVDDAVRKGELVSFNHPATVLRKSAVLKAGGYRQEFWPSEDLDLWNRIVEHGYRIAVQDEFLLKYRLHSGSTSIARARLTQQKVIWVEQCMAARRRGEPEGTWEQFVASRKSGSLLQRLAISRRELGRTFYQAAIHHYSIGRYFKLVPMLALALLLEPSLVLGRIMPRLVQPSTA